MQPVLVALFAVWGSLTASPGILAVQAPEEDIGYVWPAEYLLDADELPPGFRPRSAPVEVSYGDGFAIVYDGYELRREDGTAVPVAVSLSLDEAPGPCPDLLMAPGWALWARGYTIEVLDGPGDYSALIQQRPAQRSDSQRRYTMYYTCTGGVQTLVEWDDPLDEPLLDRILTLVHRLDAIARGRPIPRLPPREVLAERMLAWVLADQVARRERDAATMASRSSASLSEVPRFPLASTVLTSRQPPTSARGSYLDGGRGCGSRGGPGYRLANGRCASWDDARRGRR